MLLFFDHNLKPHTNTTALL